MAAVARNIIVTDGVHGLVNNFVLNIWGASNFSPAIISSTGFVLATKTVMGALNYVGSPSVRTICDLTIADLYQGVEARRVFRETFLASFAVAAWNTAEFACYMLMGIASMIVCQNNSFLTLAGRSAVQFLANSFYAGVGFIGQFSPTLALKIYVAALTHLFKVHPDLIEICKDEFSQNSDYHGNINSFIAQGIWVALGRESRGAIPADPGHQFNQGLAHLGELASGVEAELVSIVSDIREEA